MVLGVGGYSNKAKGNSIHRTAETVGLQQGEGVGGGGGQVCCSTSGNRGKL